MVVNYRQLYKDVGWLGAAGEEIIKETADDCKNTININFISSLCLSCTKSSQLNVKCVYVYEWRSQFAIKIFVHS